MTPNPNLGTITVQICRFERLRPSDGRVEWSSPLEDMQNGQVVHEKSKKMGGHCVSWELNRIISWISVLTCYWDTSQLIFLELGRPYHAVLYGRQSRDLWIRKAHATLNSTSDIDLEASRVSLLVGQRYSTFFRRRFASSRYRTFTSTRCIITSNIIETRSCQWFTTTKFWSAKQKTSPWVVVALKSRDRHKNCRNWGLIRGRDGIGPEENKGLRSKLNILALDWQENWQSL